MSYFLNILDEDDLVKYESTQKIIMSNITQIKEMGDKRYLIIHNSSQI